MRLRTKHDEQHFEPGGCFDCMRAICGQYDCFPLLHLEILAGDLDFSLTVSNDYKCIERRCVLAEALADIERE